jgi:hypothetical protein
MDTKPQQTKRARTRKSLLHFLLKPLRLFLTELKNTFVDPLRPSSQPPPRPPVKKLPPHPRPIKPPGAPDNQPKPPPTDLSRIITTMLGTDVKSGRKIGLTLDERFQSVYIIGTNGTGKTTLIENMILSDISNNHGLCLIEPHGDLTKNVIAAMPKERLKDLIYLDLTDSTSSFGLNFFECPLGADDTEVAKVASFVMHLFETVLNVGPETPRLQTVIRNITRVLIDNPGTTFAEIGLLLWEDGVREKLVRRV